MRELEHSPAQITSQLLCEASALFLFSPEVVSDASAWVVFFAETPASPRNVITVYDTSGESQGRSQRSGRVCEKYGLQIRARSVKVEDVWKKCVDVKGYLLQSVVRNVIRLGNSTYLIHSFSFRSGPLPMGMDDSQRHNYSMNFLVGLTNITS